MQVDLSLRSIETADTLLPKSDTKVGKALLDESLVNLGTTYLQEWVDEDDQNSSYRDHYNLANGYNALWRFRSEKYDKEGIDSTEHQSARHYYRLSSEHKLQDRSEVSLLSQIWVNYGISLSEVNRPIEAIAAFDRALSLNSNMGMALGNKAMVLQALASDFFGYTHLLYLESISLFELALTQRDISKAAKNIFLEELGHLRQIVSSHKDSKLIPEILPPGVEPKNRFQEFLCNFSFEHNLFLSPNSLLSAELSKFPGDPLFITSMYDEGEYAGKFERYISFLNEIKQDYIMARFFLVQSQIPSEIIDSIDEGVTLFYTLDYALYSSYVQLVKMALKQTIMVLDKIAFFIYDYCRLSKPSPTRVTFTGLWLKLDDGKIRDDLGEFKNPYLFALFTLARDLSKNGDWNYLQQFRNAITHRFLVIHSEDFIGDYNPDIPRHDIDDFINKRE